jgi:bifunctional enzyme CysN/CysC
MDSQLGLLRVMTCGSVDDGKSTLIGRMILDSGQLPEDQRGTQDLASLVDGLLDEKAQGITIDVAYRHLELEGRRLLLADAPGHEQYTRNMVTAASDADVAMLLVDATQGVTPQTRRHLFIAHLMRVPTMLLLVNKMDRVNYAQREFECIERALQDVLSSLGYDGRHEIIPIAALHGDNVLTRSPHTRWYHSPTLKESISTAAPRRGEGRAAFAVQTVLRDEASLRYYTGSVESGVIRVGDTLQVGRSGLPATLTHIVTADGNLTEAKAGDAISLQIDRELDLGRGDILSLKSDPLERSAQFEATLIWMDEEPGLSGRQYQIKLAGQETLSTLTDIKHRWDVDGFTKQPAKSLAINDLAVCTLSCVNPICFEPYTRSRAMGSFILINRQTQATVAAGLIHHGLRRSDNLRAHTLSISRESREQLNGHRAQVLWFTGLSGSGKSTLANALQSALHTRGIRCYVLDGDNIRLGLNQDLGFTAADRAENIRRVAEVAALMMDAGLVVMTAFISPFREERRMARELIGPGRFHEIHIATPLAVCELRDVKGLYQKARVGLIPNMTGIDSPYEPPSAAELTLDTSRLSIDEAVDQLLDTFFKD